MIFTVEELITSLQSLCNKGYSQSIRVCINDFGEYTISDIDRAVKIPSGKCTIRLNVKTELGEE